MLCWAWEGGRPFFFHTPEHLRVSPLRVLAAALLRVACIRRSRPPLSSLLRVLITETWDSPTARCTSETGGLVQGTVRHTAPRGCVQRPSPGRVPPDHEERP